MPERALHPLDQTYIDAHACPEQAGTGGAQAAQKYLCPLCHCALVSGGRRNGRQYFKHEDRADDEDCPLTTTSYQLAGLAVRHARELAEMENRRRFIEHWQRHYRVARAAAPALVIARFTTLIEYADVMNLWSYRRLDERDIPYILLVMAGCFTVSTRRGGVTRERFWFEGNVRSVDDLWKEGRRYRARLFRIVYRDPLHTPFPTAADILYWEPVNQIERVVDNEALRVSRADVQAFERFIERHESWRRERRERREQSKQHE